MFKYTVSGPGSSGHCQTLVPGLEEYSVGKYLVQCSTVQFILSLWIYSKLDFKGVVPTVTVT